MRSDAVVTIGVPVYNAERYLGETLGALRGQSEQNIEVVISDNASTDSTGDICQDFVRTDPRFRYIRSDANRGIQWNYDRTFELATGRQFMWNAADDIPDSRHVELCHNALDRNPDAILAFSRVVVIDSDGKQVGTFDDLGLDFMVDSPARRAGLFLQRDAYQVVGFGAVIRSSVLTDLLPMRSHFYGYDGPLAIQLAMTGKFIQIPEQSYRVRSHDWQANKLQGGDPVEQTKAYDIEFNRAIAFPQWKLTKELYRAALQGPGDARERALAAGFVGRYWTIRNWRLLAFDLKRNANRIVRGNYVGSYWR